MSLVIKNLSKRFGENWILKDVSLEVKKGEILGLFGIVGVGKSTAIRVIAGVEAHDSGNIIFESQDLSKLNCAERGFHFPQLTNDAFWKSIFKNQKSSELADGEGQVLALEDALQKVGAVLLLDNQFCFMDKDLREQNCEKLRRTAKEKNLAVIFATNDYDDVFSICDRVAVLHNGEIVQSGTPREVYEKPNSAVVARTTGSNNLIEVRRISANDADIFEFQTVEGLHRLSTARTVEPMLNGLNQNVFLTIRPEHISMSFGTSFPEDNLLKATIHEIKYRGSTTLIKLDAGGLILKAIVLRLVGLNIGDECMIGLPPDRILVLKD